MKSRRFYFAYRSFWPEFETMKRFVAAGGDTICFFPANTANSLGTPYCKYPANRLWFDRYDFSWVDRQIDDICNATGPVNLICMIDLNSPEWLSRQLNLSHESGDSMTHLSEAVSNPRWMEDTLHYLKAFLKHTEEKYPQLIQAYVLACGNTDEWFDHNGEICGLHKQKLYSEWCEKNRQPELLPSPKKLNEPDFDHLLFNPASSPEVFAYRRFCNELIGSAIRKLAENARSCIRPDVEIGVFYGYLLSRVGVAESGHGDFERVLHDPNIDFLISPGIYTDRAMGGGSGSMSPNGSELLAGKHHMLECDQRTHTYNPILAPGVKLEFPHWADTQADIAGMRREFSLALINGMSLWWFDMWGGFYQEQVLFDQLQKMKQIYERESDKGTLSPVEVVLITDPDSCWYLAQRDPRQAKFARELRQKMSRCGFPFECYTLRDIPHIPGLDKVKLFVFADQWEITPEKEALLRKYVLCGNRTIIWQYFPGISDGKSLDSARVQHFCGQTQENVSVSITQMPGYCSVYCREPDELSYNLIRDVAKRADVHIVTPQNIIVYENNHLLAIHVDRAVSVPVSLRRRASAVELFSETELPEGESFVWEFDGCGTALFRLD